MIRNLGIVAIAMLVSGLLAAQEKYTIKLRHGVQGDVSTRTQESTKKEAVTVTGPDGNVLQEKNQNIVEKFKFTEEILAKVKDQRPTKVQRTYTEATKKAGEASDKHKFHGQKVLIEKKGESFHFSIDDGKELTGEDAGHLTQAFGGKKPSDEDMDKLLLPGKPVAEGETWKINSKTFGRLLGEDEKVAKMFDLDKAKATGKLVKAYKKDGKQFGVLEYTFELPMTKLEGMFPCKEGSKMEMNIVVDGCIDGTINSDSATFTTKVKGSAEVIQDDKPTGVIIKFDISGIEKSTTTPAKK